MDKIRIGKDIRINWEITSSDESVILSKDNLTLEMTVPSKCVAVLPFTFNNNVLSATFYGIDQKQLGNYWLTVWYKRNEVGQSALDKVLAFQLVRSTEEETHNDESIAYAEVNLSGVLEINKGGGGVNLEYYTEDTEIGEAKIDNGSCSIDCYKDDGGTITINATHTDIHDDGRNSQLTVGGGVSINTKNGNRLTYNNVEVATKSDVSKPFSLREASTPPAYIGATLLSLTITALTAFVISLTYLPASAIIPCPISISYGLPVLTSTFFILQATPLLFCFPQEPFPALPDRLF